MIRHDDGHLAWPDDFVNQILCGDALAVLRQMPDACVDCVVTSPPYWGLRAYPGTARWWAGRPTCQHQADAQGYCSCGAWYGQLGLEPTWESYVEHLRSVLQEVQRVLAPHGSLWLNLGDTFLGSSGNYGAAVTAKQKLGLPFRVRFALNEDGWLSRADVVWHKPNALPSSVKDRVGTRYELLFHLVTSPRYFFDLDAIRVPHRMDTPKARQDLARMLTGRKVYQGKWANEPGVARAFVGGHVSGCPRALDTRRKKPISSSYLLPSFGHPTVIVIEFDADIVSVQRLGHTERRATPTERIEDHPAAESGSASALPVTDNPPHWAHDRLPSTEVPREIFGLASAPIRPATGAQKSLVPVRDFSDRETRSPSDSVRRRH